MDIKSFILNYKEAFSERAELPIAFWYSAEAIAETDKINGCLFKGLKLVRDGIPISLNEANIGCGGGKFYTGFAEMNDYIPQFVSLKERYKQTPEMVCSFIDKMQVPKAKGAYLNFARLDLIDSFDLIEGLLFLVTPDILSGLATWAYFDNNSDSAVQSLFGSGCSTVVTRAVLENKKQGRSTFIGFFDPSVRPYFEENILSFVIPFSRFKEMYHTMRQSCLFDTHAWSKIRDRIQT
ncbi:hypothetical protein Bcop_0791 [Bacteroides coprosuis DSM 18011]|uniref:DUF169 domain-containing protein n=1 Tax=Bacteroides coprosuis DSM 18011 TaxID=679937 RepID=F3ZT45_9BACE|nr:MULTISPECIES: DUF169 domain-containing protein [Bacteroides]EGJ71007.1 hypothetical protein Bcop_0791 [Bacteroides coprosuis DSM 18011]HJD92777.1 DUF169 domain-containing protein [Bacteroides coprosuis]